MTAKAQTEISEAHAASWEVAKLNPDLQGLIATHGEQLIRAVYAVGWVDGASAVQRICDRLLENLKP